MNRNKMLRRPIIITLWVVMFAFAMAFITGFATAVYLAVRQAVEGRSPENVSNETIAFIWHVLPIVGGLIGLALALLKLLPGTRDSVGRRSKSDRERRGG